MRIALNGFGRIGKTFLRVLLTTKHTFELVAINVGPADPQEIAYAVKYDTLLGTYQPNVEYANGILAIDGRQIIVLAQPDATLLPWKKLDVDWVVDASGAFTHAGDAQKHFQAGAKKVLITAPAHGADTTIIPGVNLEAYNPANQRIISLGSCTTNALLPVLKVIHDVYGIDYAWMTTDHAYTNSQRLLDINPEKKDPRRSRAAALNIVPTTSGAMEVVGLVMPELAGRVSGCAIRVPVPLVSLLDMTFTTRKKFDRQELNAVFRKESEGRMKAIIEVSDVPLVSNDFMHNSHSVIIDAELSHVCGSLGKIFGWYDNEWGYSCRLRDFLMYASKA